MNIEEAIEILKNIKKLAAIEWKHYITDTELSAIETLLTAYEKEKEKNKELKDHLKKRIEYTNDLEKDLFEGCNKYVINKDKIKEKIDLIDKEYADIIEKNKNNLYLLNINAQRHDAMQVVLQELLEKD